MPALLTPGNAIFERDPAQAQIAGVSVWKPAGNINIIDGNNSCNDLGLMRGPLVLVKYGPTERHTKAKRFDQAPVGHLRAHCLFWSTPGAVSINYDAARCNAERQGGAAGVRKFAGAYFSQLFACGDIRGSQCSFDDI
eukprot:1149053-Pelagomonas_calceolata.AAC.4